MKLTLIRHSIAEGLKSIIRHPLVTLASISTIALMLVLLGSFTIFSLNARHITESAGKQPPIEVSMAIGVTAEELAAMDNWLSTAESVEDYQQFTPEQNFEAFKASMENPDLFENFPVENIPYTYTIRLVSPDLAQAFKAQAEGQPGVYKVKLELTVMSFLSKAIVWVNYATLIAFIVLGVISFFIISNMVRVAVFARGEEISIMKYVGATNWYIHIPYIIEGALVGVTGALVSWSLLLLAYNQLFDVLMAGTKPTDFLTMVPAGEISVLILLINLAIGAGVGSLGSAVSVRRYIHV
jgi:cell division transport system permease protein